MKKLIKVSIILSIFLIMVNVSYAKFSTKINGEGKVKLKIPIIILEQNNIMVKEISGTKNMYQTEFTLKNYLESNETVNEIDFEYTIKVIPSTLNFPVKYTLYNTDTNEILELNDSLETGKINLGTNKTKQKYKLVVEWAQLSNIENVEENLEVKIKINAIQLEKEN